MRHRLLLLILALCACGPPDLAGWWVIDAKFSGGQRCSGGDVRLSGSDEMLSGPYSFGYCEDGRGAPIYPGTFVATAHGWNQLKGEGLLTGAVATNTGTKLYLWGASYRPDSITAGLTVRQNITSESELLVIFEAKR